MNITDILDHYNIQYKRAGESSHVSSGWVGIKCAWCDNGKGNFGLGIPPNSRRTATCWKCGAHTIAEAIQKISGAPWREILGLLGELAPVRPVERPRGRLQLPPGLGPLLPCHATYLRDRGLDPERCERLWGVQGIGLAATLAWRIWIPAQRDGEILSWTTRAIGDVPHGQRHRSAGPAQERLPLKSLLLGEDYVRHTVVVCEGALDALALGPGAVATCGVGVTPAQLARIARYPRRALVLDAEPEAQRRAERLADDLTPYPGETLNVVLEAAKDPGDCLLSAAGRRELRRLRRLFLQD